MNTKRIRSDRPDLLDIVALLTDVPADGLRRGQVGTVVELLDGDAFLVEFSDETGRAYSITLCLGADLLVLRYSREAA